jgi:general secretion pathway protein L
MKISRTDSANGGATLLVSVDEAGTPGAWRLLDASGILDRGDDFAAMLPAERPARVVLDVPGDQVAVHWLELAEGLAPAQAAAAARLLLADASAEPLSRMHVAIGRPERGLTPIALVPEEMMSTWLERAETASLDPEVMVPGPLLLKPPVAGFVRRDRRDLADYRAQAAAFTLEPELAEALVADAAVDPVDEARFEAGLATTMAVPALNLRQGPYARRRKWRLEDGRLRRIAILALALTLLTLVVQLATILTYTFAADRLEAETETLAAETPGPGADVGPGFGPLAAVLFESIRSTPNVEMTRLEYRPDGSLNATVMLDGPATFTALKARLEASGLSVEPGEMRSAGGRPTADLTLRPA